MVRVALVGAGTIAADYVRGLRATPGFEVTCVCSQSRASARAFAEEHGLAACSFEDVLADDAVDYVLNLTPAHEHARVSRACLAAGKSVYSEKPLAGSLEEADALIALAKGNGLLLGCAPATFLWPPLSTARAMLRAGRLGPIVGAATTLVYPGPELFHPAPEHLYGAEAGPLRDMGIYQVTALLDLLGPIISVGAATSQARDRRVVGVGPRKGTAFQVAAQTHVHARLTHASGAISSLTVGFDAVSATAPMLEVWGQRAGLALENWHTPDAQLYVSDGPGARSRVALTGPAWSTASLAIGPASAWRAHAAGHEVPASAQRAREALAAIHAIEAAAVGGDGVRLTSVRPHPDWSTVIS